MFSGRTSNSKKNLLIFGLSNIFLYLISDNYGHQKAVCQTIHHFLLLCPNLLFDHINICKETFLKIYTNALGSFLFWRSGEPISPPNFYHDMFAFRPFNSDDFHKISMGKNRINYWAHSVWLSENSPKSDYTELSFNRKLDLLGRRDFDAFGEWLERCEEKRESGMMDILINKMSLVYVSCFII